MTIKQWLKDTATRLKQANITSARLDAELLLAHTLNVERSWLISHDDEELTTSSKERVDSLLKRRINREPVAYILGMKEFYGREFIVTPDVLIPRPETETLIEEVLALPVGNSPHIHDVGTGSGCVPITLGLELPKAHISGSDVSHPALAVARANAERLDVNNVSFYKDSLLGRAPGKYDIITANLPYVDPSWKTSPETAHEPSLALFADDRGLVLIKQLIDQASAHLLKEGYLMLEADPRQHAKIVSYAKTHGLSHHHTKDFIVTLRD